MEARHQHNIKVLGQLHDAHQLRRSFDATLAWDAMLKSQEKTLDNIETLLEKTRQHLDQTGTELGELYDDAPLIRKGTATYVPLDPDVTKLWSRKGNDFRAVLDMHAERLLELERRLGCLGK